MILHEYVKVYFINVIVALIGMRTIQSSERLLSYTARSIPVPKAIHSKLPPLGTHDVTLPINTECVAEFQGDLQTTRATSYRGDADAITEKVVVPGGHYEPSLAFWKREAFLSVCVARRRAIRTFYAPRGGGFTDRVEATPTAIAEDPVVITEEARLARTASPVLPPVTTDAVALSVGEAAIRPAAGALCGQTAFAHRQGRARHALLGRRNVAEVGIANVAIAIGVHEHALRTHLSRLTTEALARAARRRPFRTRLAQSLATGPAQSIRHERAGFALDAFGLRLSIINRLARATLRASRSARSPHRQPRARIALWRIITDLEFLSERTRGAHAFDARLIGAKALCALRAIQLVEQRGNVTTVTRNATKALRRVRARFAAAAVALTIRNVPGRASAAPLRARLAHLPRWARYT